MKHLYKTKEGEILEANMIDLSEVQEVVLDKDGEPFMFEGEVVCLGNYFDGKEIIGFHIADNEIVLETGTKNHTVYRYPETADKKCSHTPKHPQKKGIEKIDKNKMNESFWIGDPLKEIANKLNEVIEEINKLKE